MKNAISFFFKTKLYKGRITYQRVKEIIESYGFTLIEYDLTADDEIVEILRSFSLLGHAAAYDCFTHVVDTHHKYVFLKSGNTDKDKIYLLLHEAGHIYEEHFTSKELVHHTSTAKERRANLFSSAMLFLNHMSRTFPCLLALAVLTGILFTLIYSTDSPEEDMPDIVYFTEGGEVYHLFEDCHHIENSNALSGTIEACRKHRVCETCRARWEKDGAPKGMTALEFIKSLSTIPVAP